MLSKIKDALTRRQLEEGATAVEYGIMVALIAVVIIAAVAFIGTQLQEDFSCVGESLNESASSASC